MRIVGVDTGGTFTDLVLIGDGPMRIEKVPSTPRDPTEAIVDGLRRISPRRPPDLVVHGTTVALNALLTGRVARTALVTNRGFRDLVEIGRQDRPDLYAIEPRKPEPLVPRALRFEIEQRSAPRADGASVSDVRAWRDVDLARLRASLRRARPESIAICLLHAWADPTRELELARALRELGVPITCSGALLAQHREFERFSTAIVNAALTPLMQRYLERLERRVRPSRLALLQSIGGTLPLEHAAREPARVLLSGPAGGIAGAALAARELALPSIVTLDMGGTSTDVGFHAAARARGAEAVASGTAEPSVVAGQPVALPALDLHTIGCGGGSLLWIDSGGALRVGPGSAGADPGPACFGKSMEPTLTDAHLVLGHLQAERFLAGRMRVDAARAHAACARLARRAGVRSAHALAAAAVAAARAAMRRAISVMTLERGRDPRKLALVAFGGAGGLHAAALAHDLEMECAVIPRFPGALSALGMALALGSAESTRTLLQPLRAWSSTRLAGALDELERTARSELERTAQGDVARSRDARGRATRTIERRLELRYVGQSFELSIPAGPQESERFHAAHAARYGYRIEDRDIELVALRVRVSLQRRTSAARSIPWRAAPRSARVASVSVVLDGAPRAAVCRAPLWLRESLRPGDVVRGPAVISEFSCTTLVPPRWHARVHAGEHLVLRERRRPRA